MSNTSRSPSGQWYPQQQQQQQQWQQGAGAPQWSPAGTPPATPGGPPWGGGYAQPPPSPQHMPPPSPSQLPRYPAHRPPPSGGSGHAQDGQHLNTSGVLNTSGTWNGGGPPGMMMPGPQGMMMMNAGMGMAPGGMCDCCGGPQQPGCCPQPGEPLEPYVCAPTAFAPPCYACVYDCFDYTFILMCLAFIGTVLGFGLVVGTKGRDDIYTHFNVRTAVELDDAMLPYINWLNPNSTCPPRDSSSESGSLSGSGVNISGSGASSQMNSSSRGSGNDSAGSGGAPVVPPAGARTYRYGTEGYEHARGYVGKAPPPPPERAITVDQADYLANWTNGSWCIQNYTRNCTTRRLLGSFGQMCMEDNLNANVFSVQLSHWTNARDTMWLIAMVYAGVALILAGLIHAQRHPANPFLAGMNPAMLPPERQAELMKLPPQQQQLFMMEYMMNTSLSTTQMAGAMGGPGSAGGAPRLGGLNSYAQMQAMMRQQACGGTGSLEVYDTPFYEFMRFAWGFVGLVIFAWTCNLCISFWSFSSFYVNQTTGPLHDFWHRYTRKFNGSVIMVTIFLAWPLCNIALELVVWIVGFLPWFLVRSTCKQNIGNYRPSLSNTDMPGWIRADMFFMDFADLKRLGFSRQAWIMLTGSDRPYFDSCAVDPMVDTDPNMTNLLTQRYQWQMQMYHMMPPWARAMMPPPMPPPGLSPEQIQQLMMYPTEGGMMGAGGHPPHTPPDAPLHGGQNSDSATPHAGAAGGRRGADKSGGGGGGGAPAEVPTGRHRHRRSRGEASESQTPADAAAGAGAEAGGTGRRRRRAHGDPATAATPQEEATPSRRHRHSRSRSLSKGDGLAGVEASALRRSSHRGRGESRSRGGAADGGGASRRVSRSREANAAGLGETPPAVAPPGAGGAGEESVSRRHRRSRSRSRSRSKGANADRKERKERRDKKDKAEADLDALMQL